MLLVLFLTLPNSTNLFGQIVIKERVKIEPKVENSDKKNNEVQTEYWPCGPYPQGTRELYRQVVWRGSSYPLDIEQHAFNIQDNVRYAHTYCDLWDYYGNKIEEITYFFEIVSGSEYCTVWHNFPFYGGADVYTPPQKVTESFYLSYSEMVGSKPPVEYDENGDVIIDTTDTKYMLWQGVKTSMNFRDYSIEFHTQGTVVFRITTVSQMILDSDPPYIYKDTMTQTCETIVVEPDYELRTSFYSTSIPYLEEINLDVNVAPIQCSPCPPAWTTNLMSIDTTVVGEEEVYDTLFLYSTCYWNGGSFPDENTFNVEIISGSEYGTLSYLMNADDPENAYKDEGNAFYYLPNTSSLKFFAKGEMPNEDSKVVIRFSTSGPNPTTSRDVEIPIIENPNYPLRVNIEPSTLSAGDTAKITFEKRDEYWDDPTYYPFDEDQLFDVSIIKGAELGTLFSDYEADEFYLIPQENLFFIADTNVTIDEILIKASTEILDAQWGGNNANYQKRSNRKGKDIIQPIGGATGGETLYGIGKISSFDHFEISIIPDTLSFQDTLSLISLKDTVAFTEIANLIIQAKDADSNNIDIENSSLLKFQVLTNKSYGTFIKVNGDTLKIDPVELVDISYEDANAGKIKFAAVKDNPNSEITCNIRVELIADTTKNGEKEVIVLEKTLKIVMNGDREVKPTYFNSRGTRIGRAVDSREVFDVIMTRGNKPVEGHEFELYTNYVNGSGGHNHTNIRPDTEENYGYFLRVGNDTHVRPLVDTTNAQGRVDNLTYVASIFGDTMRVFIKSLKNKLMRDSLSIVERVPTLEVLGVHANYILYGGSENHNGPPNFTVDNNHYGTPTLNGALENIASDYITAYQGVRIRINDMSLPNGGKFDINGSWGGSHSSHRCGKNADISARGINESGTLVELNLIKMRAIIRNRTGINPLFHNPPHFHIYSR